MTARGGTVLRWAGSAVGGVVSGAWRRITTGLWPVLQQTAAATLSWWIARHVVEHHQPIFAPITTLVALNAARGERGTNALRFVLGVLAGVLVAQVTIAVLGQGYGTLAAATLVSMLVALAVGGERVTLAQAAVSAILAIAVGGPQNGPARAYDALLGGGVALVVSQALFPSEPIGLLRRAESAALCDLVQALRLTAGASSSGGAVFSDWTREQLRVAYSDLAKLSATRTRTGTAARWSPVWWGRGKRVGRERANAARLDLLGNSCLTLTRTMRALDEGHRSALVPLVGALADTLERLAAAPGDGGVRQREAERVVTLAGRIPASGDLREPALAVSRAMVRAVAYDVLLFTGVGDEEATRAVREGTGRVRASTPAALRRTPFRRHRRHEP